MAEYLVAFNGEWVPDHTSEEIHGKARAVRALQAEMRAAGVLVFIGGLDDTSPVFSVDVSGGEAVFRDGAYAETADRLGGFAVLDVPDEEAARWWAGRIALACGWPQEVSRFQVPMELPDGP